MRSFTATFSLLLVLLLAPHLLCAQEPATPIPAEVMEADVDARLRAIEGVLDARYEVLEAVTRDYAHWDDAYLFATGARGGFPGAGLLPPALSRLGIHRMLVLDGSFATRLALTIRAAPLGQSLTTADPQLVESIRAFAQAGSTDREQVWRGVSFAGGAPIAIVARPILRTGSSRPGGWLAFSQPLNEAELRESLRTAVPDAMEVPLASLPIAESTAGLQSWLETPGPEAALYSEVRESVVDTWLTVRDLTGRPFWVARLQTPAPVSESPVSEATPAASVAQEPAPAPSDPPIPLVLAAAIALLVSLGASWLWHRRRRPGSPASPAPAATILPVPVSPPAVPVRAPTPASPPSAPPAALSPAQPAPPDTSAPASPAAPTAMPVPAVAPVAKAPRRENPAPGTSPDSVVVMYQPIIDLRTERVWALAARLRWKEISRGWIEPRDDIRIQSGTGEPLTSGRYVLQAAARDIHQWRSAGVTPAAVSVQFAVSLTSFDDARTGLQHAGEAWQVGPETLQIELSVESVLDSRTGRIYRDVVTLWRQLGLPIVVRRWGARRGVHPVPMLDGVDALKLDVRLVNEIDLFPAARETLSELMEQAASKGIPVIAEGVDRWRQLETLRAVDCHLAQGPLLLHAVAGPEVPDLLRAGVFRIRVPDALELTDELPALPGSQA